MGKNQVICRIHKMAKLNNNNGSSNTGTSELLSILLLVSIMQDLVVHSGGEFIYPSIYPPPNDYLYLPPSFWISRFRHIDLQWTSTVNGENGGENEENGE